ncbi:Bifunctional hemolysin/adenylate cyclase precursor [Rosistilla carotiformis]|uniref:Bifunctional hemolysin/adenylate cyclase n=1 Tax=Rosistilla carotiformis TaxID=2528017 RepID=A0A518K1J8_9BACT|nr:calcium-binding protein [Rosistilla carotiformis]QDV71683.1 Bifunctional hemolysin/adenylate cyclase precursor [Rosistilla carotiformis]
MKNTIKKLLKAFSIDTADTDEIESAPRKPWISDLETVEPMVLMSASPLEGIEPTDVADGGDFESTIPTDDSPIALAETPVSDIFDVTDQDAADQNDLLSENTNAWGVTTSVSADAGSAQEAKIAVSAETGTPGQPIDVVISAEPEPGDQVEKVELSGLPEGAQVQIGGSLVQPVDGKVEVAFDKLDELKIVPPSGSADDFDVTISVTTTDGNDRNVTEETFTVEIDPTVDVTAANVSGNQGDAIAVDLKIDSEAADHLFAVISGLPDDSKLVVGETALEDIGGQTLVQRDQLNDLQFVPADGFSGTVDLKVTGLATDGDSDAAVDLAKFTVDVAAKAIAIPDDGVEAAQLNAVADTAVVGQKVDLTINAAAVGDDAITAVAIENLPTGAKVEAGGIVLTPINGKVGLNASDFNSVKIVPPAGSADDFDVTVRVTTTDNGVSRDVTQVVNIDIDPEVKVSADNVVGTEGGPIDLNLKLETQGAAQTTVVIKGIPDGSTLVSGGVLITPNNGEALVRAEQLNGLALNPAPGLKGTIDLTAKVVAVDNDLDAVSVKTDFKVNVLESNAGDAPSNAPQPSKDAVPSVDDVKEVVVEKVVAPVGHTSDPAVVTPAEPVAPVKEVVVEKVVAPVGHKSDPVVVTPAEPVAPVKEVIVEKVVAPVGHTSDPVVVTPAEPVAPAKDVVVEKVVTPVGHTSDPVVVTPAEPVASVKEVVVEKVVAPVGHTSDPVAVTPAEPVAPAKDVAADLLVQTGTDGNDKLVGTNGNDKIDGGKGHDTIDGGKGDDLLNGGDGNDKINGGDGNDHIDGGAGNDILNGGNGNDKIDGGAGNDTIDGGKGDDLLNGGDGNDKINGGDGNDHLTGGAGTDTLNGGNGNDVLDGSDDATRDTLNGGAGNDKIIAGKNDVANGGAGDDVIVAKAGNVKVNGGAGNDTLDLSELPPDAHKPAEINVPGGVANVGGEKVTFQNIEKVIGTAGDDNFSFSGAANGNKFNIDGGEGHNTIDLSNIPEKDITIADGKISINTIMSARDGHGALTNQKMSFEIHFDNIENVKVQGGKVLDIEGEVARHEQNQATDGNDHQVGSDNADVFDAGAGDDKIEGGAGNDKLNGGDGNDVIDGGKGNDVIDGGKGNDNLSGGDGNDKIEGGDGNDHIDGGAGADTINGGDGNDKIDGGDGNDRISGGAGDDVIEGGAGNDVIDGNEGNDTLTGGEGSDTLRGGKGDDVIDGSDDATRDTLNGDNGDDKIIAGKNDVANGGTGDDVIIAKAGNVKVNGGAGHDTLDLSELPPDAHKPAEINVASGVANVGGEKVTFQNIEKVIGTTGDDNFSFSGAENGDKFTVDGGEGHNTIDLSNIPEKDLTIADGKITINTIMSARDGHGALTNQKMSFEIHFDNIENVKVQGGKVLDIEGEVARHEQNQATDGNDHQVGSDNADVFDAGAGDDKIEGGAGNDKLNGGDGNDVIDGGKGNDVIDGGKGNDHLSGGDGNDKIEGGEGNDHIDGGDGADTINGGDGNDKIDGGDGNDRIAGGAGDDVIEGGAGNDIIDGNEGNDTLTGGEGSDTLRGGKGDDVIDGSDDATRDTLNGDNGDDKIIAGKNDVANGGAGDDVIVAKAGNVKVNGGAGHDTLDLSELPPDAHKPAEINVASGVANVGGEKVTFQNIEKVIGTTGDDNFSFSGAENGDKFTVDGGAGHNTIDLSNIPEKDITIADGKIRINTIMSARDGHGALTNQKMSFEIHFDNIENVKVQGGKVLDLEPVEAAEPVEAIKEHQKPVKGW